MANKRVIDRPPRLANIAELGFLSLLMQSGPMFAREMFVQLGLKGLIDSMPNFNITVHRMREVGWIRTVRDGGLAKHEITVDGQHRLAECAKMLRRAGFPASIEHYQDAVSLPKNSLNQATVE
jgi:hypothetical protein